MKTTNKIKQLDNEIHYFNYLKITVSIVIKISGLDLKNDSNSHAVVLP